MGCLQLTRVLGSANWAAVVDVFNDSCIEFLEVLRAQRRHLQHNANA